MATDPSGEFAPAVAFRTKPVACGGDDVLFVGIEKLTEIIVKGTDLYFGQPMVRGYDAVEFFRQWLEDGKVLVPLGGNKFNQRR